jgi:hypothetical protein
MHKLILFVALLFFWKLGHSTSRVEELFDRGDFVENPKISERFWSNKENKLYGKSVILWNEQDFAALEKKLGEQQKAERAIYLALVEKRGYVSLEDKVKYESHRNNLDAALKALPEIRVWTDIARVESGEKLEEAESGAPQDSGGSGGGGRTGGDEHDPDNYLKLKGRDSTDEEIRLKEYLEGERATYGRKRRILFYAALAAIGVIALVAGMVWFRLYRVKDMVCPKCKTSEKGMITASAPLKKGSSIFKGRVRRKYYCQACGYKWVQRTR